LLPQSQLDRRLVELFGFPLLDGDGSFRAVTQAGAQTIAVALRDEPCLPVHDGKRALHAVGDAKPAAIAFFLVDVDDLPQRPDSHFLSALPVRHMFRGRGGAARALVLILIIGAAGGKSLDAGQDAVC
jgi:hypothetical protein